MRRALLLAAVLLAACAAPAGSTVEVCDATWREVDSVIVTPSGADAEAVAIACMRQVDEKRVRIGFSFPPGPTCFVVTAVEVVEGADAVSLTVLVAPGDDTTAGACPANPGRTTTEVDLQASIGDRVLLDGRH